MTVDATTRLLSVEEALASVLAAMPDRLATEELVPDEALGRWLAAPVVATTDLPPWDNSAMDGYAIRAADTSGAGEDAPIVLRVSGEVRAGESGSGRVEAGHAFRIATGAPLPAGADAVVPVEQTTPLDAAGEPSGPRGREASGPLPFACAVHVAVEEGGSVRRRGDDLRGGTTVLEAGARLGPGGVALAAGAGVGTVSVHGRPRVGVLGTGDEVREPGRPLGPAGIPDANGPSLRALVASAGGVAVPLGIARDELADVVGRLSRALKDVDAMIVSGGVSVGPYDVVRAAFGTIGRVDLWRVAVQPGKPFAFGTAERPDGRPDPAVRAAREPRIDRGHVRALRAACPAPPGRRAGSASRRRSGGPARSRLDQPGSPGVPARGRGAHPGRRRGARRHGPRIRVPGGQARGVTS